MKQTARIIRNNVPYTLLSNGVLYGESIHVPTVAAARLLPDPPPPMINIGSTGVSVSGTYYWDAASTASDDGQTVIKVTAITTGRYIPVSIVTSGGSGTGLSVSNVAALKAVLSSTLTDTQPATIQTPGSNWVWSASTGAGFESDDVTVIRPTNVALGSNGRWYSTSSSPVVPTIAAARLAVSGKQPTISVQAHSSLNDGGGGIFEYDSSDTTSADNGGTIIVAGTRRYKRRYDGLINARWFGAKGDGVTDDRVSIQAALNYVATLQVNSTVPDNGITYATPGVFLPAGKYRVSRIPGRYHCLELTSVVGLYGEPSATMIEPVDADRFDVEILMVAVFKNVVKDVIFTRAFSGIGLCGVSEYYGTFSAAVGGERTVIDGCEFYQCAGPAVLHNPDSVATNRSIQAAVTISNCRHQGPHFYWGANDGVHISHCTLIWDPYNPAAIASPPPVCQLDDTAKPLGLITSNGHCFVDNCIFLPNGVSGTAVVHPRLAYLRGSGEISVTDSTFYDLGFVLCREGLNGSETTGPWATPQELPGTGDPTARLSLKVRNCYLPVAAGGGHNVLEVYDFWPEAVIFQDNSDHSITGALGIMVESAVDLDLAQQQHAENLVIRIGQQLSTTTWKIRQCDDADFDDITAGTDVTEIFATRWEEPFERKHISPTRQANIFLPDKYNSTQLESAAGGTGITADTSTGFSLQMWRADLPSDKLSFRTQNCGGLGWSAGIYTFSFYIKTTTSTVLSFGYQLDGGAGTNIAYRRVAGSPHWQRVECPFYYPGAATSIKFIAETATLADATESGTGLFMVNPGMVAAPYVFPKDSTTAIADTSAPSDPADPNGEIASWLRPGNPGRWRAAIPTTGIYLRGEVYWNISPSFGTPIGWICTAGGEPGTWISFGAIGLHLSGTGTPEGAVTAPVGTLFSRTDGGAGTTLYVKESGSGNTGWVGK